MASNDIDDLYEYGKQLGQLSKTVEGLNKRIASKPTEFTSKQLAELTSEIKQATTVNKKFNLNLANLSEALLRIAKREPKAPVIDLSLLAKKMDVIGSAITQRDFSVSLPEPIDMRKELLEIVKSLETTKELIRDNTRAIQRQVDSSNAQTEAIREQTALLSQELTFSWDEHGRIKSAKRGEE